MNSIWSPPPELVEQVVEPQPLPNTAPVTRPIVRPSYEGAKPDTQHNEPAPTMTPADIFTMAQPTFFPETAKTVLAVTGACGAIGATTLAIACSYVLNTAQPTFLIDVQTASGLETQLGLDQMQGLRWPQLHGAQGHIDLGGLHRLMPNYLGVPVLTNSVLGVSAPDNAAVSALLGSLSAYPFQAVINASKESFVQHQTLWSHAVVVAPLTVQGAANVVSLKKLTPHVPTFVVTSDVIKPEISVKHWNAQWGYL